ncbi:hypothetical protein ABUV18_01587 [Clavibacter nebraskensis]
MARSLPLSHDNRDPSEYGGGPGGVGSAPTLSPSAAAERLTPSQRSLVLRRAAMSGDEPSPGRQDRPIDSGDRIA